MEILQFSSLAVTSAERHALTRAELSGRLTRLASGVYADAAWWTEASPEQRHRQRIAAAAQLTRQELVVARSSAVLLHGLPWIGAWPERAQFAPVAGLGRSTKLMAVSGYPPESVEVIDGLAVTTVARTVVDIAREYPMERALAVVDAALRAHPSLPASIADELARVGRFQGEARAAATLRLADGSAESPGESLSRAVIARLGFPLPQLQAEFPRAGGGRWRVDFWWPQERVVGEFDGAVKYAGGGDSAVETVIAEKRREDELRALGLRVCRWDWATAMRPPDLQRVLRGAGLRPRSAR